MLERVHQIGVCVFVSLDMKFWFSNLSEKKNCSTEVTGNCNNGMGKCLPQLITHNLTTYNRVDNDDKNT